MSNTDGTKETDEEYLERFKQHGGYCDWCDGVGWYEGGETIVTICEQCHGTGWADGKP